MLRCVFSHIHLCWFMRHQTKLFRFQFVPRGIFWCASGLVFVAAVVWMGMNSSFDGLAILEEGKNTTAGADESIVTKRRAKTGEDSHVAPDGFSPETLPRYLESEYSDISWLVTHNSMSNRADGWWFPNQSYGITRQLDDGVRGLMLDVHMIDGQPFLVHGASVLGAMTLESGLIEVKAFMQRQSNAIITLILESYAPAHKVREAFDVVGLSGMVHQQQTGSSWPKIGDMIARGKRLVVFTDSGGGEWQGYHDVWDFCQETHYSVKQVEDFSFQRNRGEEANSLLILNHFLTHPIAGLGLAGQANATDVLKTRLEECEKATKCFPNFVAVDFYECGDTPNLLFEFNRQQAEKQKAEP